MEKALSLGNNESRITPEEEKVLEQIEMLGLNREAKEYILLVWKDMKPAAQFSLNHFTSKEERDNPTAYEKVEKLFDMLGIRHMRTTSETTGSTREGGELVPCTFYKNSYLIAKQKDDLHYLAEHLGKEESVEATRRLGEILGYPDTAIEAWLASDRSKAILHEAVEEPELLTQDYMAFRKFRLSKAHWREEIQTLQKWADEIRRLNPVFYEKIVADYHRTVKESQQNGK